MTSIASVCDHLRSVADATEEHRLESALAQADAVAVREFHGLNANQVLEFQAARKTVQSRLNRLRSARNRRKP